MMSALNGGEKRIFNNLNKEVMKYLLLPAITFILRVLYSLFVILVLCIEVLYNIVWNFKLAKPTISYEISPIFEDFTMKLFNPKAYYASNCDQTFFPVYIWDNIFDFIWGKPNFNVKNKENYE